MRWVSLVASLWMVLLAVLVELSVAAPGCQVVEDFKGARVGSFPLDWTGRKNAAKDIYTVQEERGVRFLHAVARNQGIQAARELDWDLKAYPVLAWSWRPRESPRGADERDARTNDSALAVYAVFPNSPVSAKTLKYVWSAIVPRGTHLSHSKGLTQLTVVRSGTAATGGWIEERVNVPADYKKYFGGDEVPRPAGIAVLTDSDDTRSIASGDYANFRVCRE